MLFESTRGGDKGKTFEEVLLKGLADDGGLYIPTEWPQADISKLKECNSFIDIAKLIVPLFTESSYKKEEVVTLLENTWHDFEKSDLVGIKKINEDIFIGELFHGPTAAFKDFGLQLAAAFFNKVLESENKTAIVLGATSGDTGSAAIDACKNYDRIKSFIMLPNGNMSEVQQRQMSTIKSSNIFALKINGTFDDCQDLVKQAFQKRDFLSTNQYLLAVNSINWTRIIGQICYYFYAYNQLSKKGNLNFSIPTGNFGNVFACYSAHKMGLPVDKISVAVNNNDILHRFFNENDYSQRSVCETISPSMDISVASNFERLVYDLFLDRDASQCAEMFENFPIKPIELDISIWNKKKNLFSSCMVNDFDTENMIKRTYQSDSYLLDPHTAVAAVEAFSKSDKNNHYVLLSTAHPAKFPKVYEKLNIKINSSPTSLKGLFKKDEYLHTLDADYNKITNFIKLNN